MPTYPCLNCKKFTSLSPGICPRCGSRLGEPPRDHQWPLGGGHTTGVDPEGDKKGKGGPLAVKRKWERATGNKPLTWQPPKAESTKYIPTKLIQVTSCFNVSSIAATGLQIIRAATSGGLSESSSNRDYALRDACLRAIYLAKNADVGASMTEGKDKIKEQIHLVVRLPDWFVEKWVRFNKAVVNNDPKTVGDSVICFNDIPPKCIFFTIPKGFKYAEADAREKPISQWGPPPGVKEIMERKKAMVARIKAQEQAFRRRQAESVILKTETLAKQTTQPHLFQSDSFSAVVDKFKNLNRNNDSDDDWSEE